jgi:hypothetical protein
MDSKAKVETKLPEAKTVVESKQSAPHVTPSVESKHVSAAELAAPDNKSKEPLVQTPDDKTFTVSSKRPTSFDDLLARMSPEDKKKYHLAEDGDKPPIAALPQLDDPHGPSVRGNTPADTQGSNAPKGAITHPDGTIDIRPLQVERAKASNPQASQLPKSSWRLKLPDNPPVVMLATDPYQAIKLYNQTCGVVRTIHEHQITQVLDD